MKFKQVLLRRALPIALAAGLVACATPRDDFSYSIATLPEGPSGDADKPGWPAQKFMVAAASHLSIVDARRRAVAMTTTIEDVFGSRRMSDGGTGKAGGFLLNNELTATPSTKST
jgi:Gamma-glutamyltranspeptidase